MISQSTVIAGVAIAAFVLYISAKGSLPQYLSVLWGTAQGAGASFAGVGGSPGSAFQSGGGPSTITGQNNPAAGGYSLPPIGFGGVGGPLPPNLTGGL